MNRLNKNESAVVISISEGSVFFFQYSLLIGYALNLPSLNIIVTALIRHVYLYMLYKSVFSANRICSKYALLKIRLT